MRFPSTAKPFATVCLCLALGGSAAFATDPVEEWYVTDGLLGVAASALDSQGNLAVGELHATSQYGPDGTLLWKQPFSIPTGHTILSWLAVDSQDNVIRGGYLEGPGDGYLAVKYDSAGNLLWSRVADIDTGEQARRIEVDEFDNMYLFGEANEGFTKRWLTVKIDSAGQVVWHRWSHVAEPTNLAVRDGQVAVAGESNGGNFVTVSYDYDGNTNWDNTFQPASSGVNHMVIGAAGQVVVCGWGTDTTGGGSAGTVLQYDVQGQEQWVAFYNGPYGGIEIFRKLAIDDTSGEVVAVGYGLSPSDDAWSIVKFDTRGQLLWTQLYDNVNFTGFEYAYSVTLGPAGAVYVGGLSDRNGSCGFGSLEGQILKYTADGDFLWHNHLVCGGYPTQIHLDSQGGVFAVPLYSIKHLREGFVDLGSGLGGVSGVPTLGGTGSLIVGEPTTYTLTNGNPDALAFLVVGLSDVSLPLAGGTLVPSLDLQIPIVTDSGGNHVLSANWPAGIPDGTSLYIQEWVVDPAGPSGFSASNGLQTNP